MEELLKRRVEEFFEDYSTREELQTYLKGGGDESEVSAKNLAIFRNLKEERNATLSRYFDWKELDQASDYTYEMLQEGWTLFDISCGDYYLWLMIK